MKKILFIFLIIFTLFVQTAGAYDDYSHIDGDDFFNSTVDSLSSGEFKLSPHGIITYIYNTFIEEMSAAKDLLFSIFIIAMLSGLLNVMKQGEDGVSNAAFFSCYCLMIIAVAKIIGVAVGYGTEVIEEMSAFVTKLAPMLSILLVSGGYAVSAASFYPVFSATVFFVGMIIEKCIVPLIYIGCVTGIINNMSAKVRLNNFNRLVKSFSKWILTGTLTMFSAINALYGFCKPAIDGVGIKAAKFAIGSIVPVVGGFLSESIETVIGTTHLIKNAVGTAGIVALIVMCSVPAVKVAAIMIMLKISAALIEPVGDKRFADMITEAAEAVTSVLAAILIVSLLFILSVAIIITSTNAVV